MCRSEHLDGAAECRLRRVARLLAVIIPLEAHCSADCGIVLRATFAKFCGAACKIGAEAARLDDRHLYAERSNLFV